MENETKIIEQEFAKIPQNMGDYDDLVQQGVTSFGVKERVNRYSCEFESIVENNTYAPATLVNGVVTPDTAHWRLVTGIPANYGLDGKFAEMREELDTEKEKTAALEEAVGTGGSVDERIATEAAARENAVSAETNRAQAAEENLRQLYNSLSQSQPIPVTSLPATGEAGKIYRLAGTNSYADYMYAEGALTTPVKMAEYDNAIDDEPTAGSDNLVKSGGVFNDTHITTDYIENIEKSAFIVKSFGNYQEGDIAELAVCALSYPIKVHKGDKVKYNLRIGDSGWSCALYSGKETEHTTFITHLDNGDKIPVDGYIRFGYNQDITPSPLFEIHTPVNSSIEILQKELENTSIITENLTNEATEVGFICKSFGNHQEGDFVPFNGCLCSNPIKVYKGDTIVYTLGIGSAGWPCALYSSSEADHNTFISNLNSETVLDRDGYLRFCHDSSITPSFKIIRNLYNKFVEIEETIEKNKNIIDVYLPNKLYVSVGINCCLYHYNLATVIEDDAVIFRINGAGQNFKNVWKYNPQNTETDKTLEVIINDRNLNHIQGKRNKCTLVTVPNTGLTGTKTVLICGSSNVQAGLFVPYFYHLFEDVSINLIGRYGFDADKHREGQGSMPITGYLKSQGVCYLCQVTGLTEEATVGYVTNGTTYRDTNNIEFQCRENRATNGNGYMVLWGEQSPAVGTLTKVNGPGSSEVTIVSVEEIDKNPFYNRQESKVDFNWYLTKYGFDTPDVIILDEWTNTARANLTTADFVELYKQFVDIVHQQIPNCKIMINASCHGVPSPYNDAYEDNKLSRKYWYPMRDFFENNSYQDFVYIHNKPAWIDPVRSYNQSTILINDITGETENVLDDNVHTNNIGGQLVGNSLYSAVRGLLLDL